MTQPAPAAQAEDLLKAVQTNADRLGLVWALRAATVEGNSNPLELSVRADLDITLLPAVPLVAVGAVNARGYLLTLPDGSNYFLTRAMHRLETEALDTGTAGFTAETIVHTLTVYGIPGYRYRIYVDTHMGSTVSTDTGNLRIRFTDLSGTELNSRFNVPITVTTSGGNYMTLSGEWEPTVEGDQTFVVTMQRGSGTGNVSLVAATTRMSVFAIDYISG